MKNKSIEKPIQFLTVLAPVRNLSTKTGCFPQTYPQCIEYPIQKMPNPVKNLWNSEWMNAKCGLPDLCQTDFSTESGTYPPSYTQKV